MDTDVDPAIENGVTAKAGTESYHQDTKAQRSEGIARPSVVDHVLSGNSELWFLDSEF